MHLKQFLVKWSPSKRRWALFLESILRGFLKKFGEFPCNCGNAL